MLFLYFLWKKIEPDNNSYKIPVSVKDTSKQEYGTDSYNRPGRGVSAIGPSRAGWPGSAIHKQGKLIDTVACHTIFTF